MAVTLIFDAVYEEDGTLFTPTVVTSEWTVMYRSENTVYLLYYDVKNMLKMSINAFIDMITSTKDGILDLRDWQIYLP